MDKTQKGRVNLIFGTEPGYIIKGVSRSLLIIGDNTGETVFDRLLLEESPPPDFTYAVRSAPIINDATLEDAQASGFIRGKYYWSYLASVDLPVVLANRQDKMGFYYLEKLP